MQKRKGKPLKVISLKVEDTEHRAIKKAASRWRDGNVSLFIRDAVAAAIERGKRGE